MPYYDSHSYAAPLLTNIVKLKHRSSAWAWSWRDVVLAMDKEEHPSHEEAIVKEKELERRQSRAGRSAIYNRFETHNTKSQTTKYKAENTKYTSIKYKTQITRRQSGAVWLAIYNASEALKLRFATSLSLLHSSPAQRLQPNSNHLCNKKKKIW